MLYLKKLKIILQSNLLYFFLFFFLCVFVYVKTNLITYDSTIPEDIGEITATIVSYNIDGDKLSLELKEREKFIGTYYISSKEEKEYFQKNLKIGQTIEVFGEKSQVLENTIPNTFNYKKYLYNKKIYFSFLVQNIKVFDSKMASSAILKDKVQQRIKKLNNNPYLEAFILGDKNLMQSDIKDKIQENGVSHLFALSGMHLSFIYLFLEKILKKIKYKKIVIYSFLFFYLILTSFPVSFIRAILLTFFLDINKILSLKISKIKILFLIAFFLLLFNPFYIYDLGFLYTFVVTFSLLFCHDLLQKKNKLIQIGMVSIITFLFSAPISIYNNYEINLFSVINNIILVPFVSSIVFPFAILTFFFSFLLPLFTILTNILEQLNSFLCTFSFFLVIGKIMLYEVCLYYLFLIGLLKLRWKLFYFLFLGYIIFLYHKDIFKDYSSVYFLDVGQGDATLFVAPQNKEVILIDTGGKITYEKEEWQFRNNEFNLADNLLEFFKSIRIRKIHLLLLTHGDLDHVGYAKSIISNIKVKQVMINQDEANSYEKEIVNQVSQVKNYHSKYFHYQNLITRFYDNENDNSLVSYFKIENLTFLLMGDASKKVELDLLKKYNLQDVDVLKVGHHGSKTSSSKSFIDEINPKYSIISVGKNNRYGHPNKETLNNFDNSKIFRTDQDGSIIFKIKNDKLKIETCVP